MPRDASARRRLGGWRRYMPTTRLGRWSAVAAALLAVLIVAGWTTAAVVIGLATR